ncbi:hypothetical protein F5Y10DRAFT_14035 [Nemania abortiva]|nr:hypothetical protein F5Y10DRAFT_14035 [Nemania abortiva]
MKETASICLVGRRAVPVASPQLRTDPGPLNCEVTAYPSTGGIVTGWLSGVELEWLGLPRSSPALPRPQPNTQTANSSRTGSSKEKIEEEEDTFALQLMRLGGRWWPSRAFRDLHDSLHFPYGYHYPPDLHVAYSPPSSLKQAVILLKTFPDNSPHRLPDDAPRRPDDWSRLAACKTMEERWAVLRDFGATEYDDVKMCADIPYSLEEGVEEGRRYEQLLRKMQDGKYFDQWLATLGKPIPL